MNKFKMRCKCPHTDESYFHEVVGEKCFEYKGFSFYIHGEDGDWTVSDVLCGMKICSGINNIALIENAKKLIEKQFDKYISQCKTRSKTNWKRQMPIESIYAFGMFIA